MNFRERIAFLGQTGTRFEHTGALQPSSRWLARAMAAPIRRGHESAPLGKRRILEIGPGTGAVTRAIAAEMTAGDALVCYEINPVFVAFLTRALREDAALAPIAEQTEIRQAAAQEVPPSPPFDFAVCSAPLNNFDAVTVGEILDAAIGALRKGGVLTLFEYVGLPVAKRALSLPAARRRLDGARDALRQRTARYGVGSTVVWTNLPPARVHELVR